MKIKELKLKGCYEISLTPLSDYRGFFMRSYDEKIFRDNGLDFNWIQENHSQSLKKGTVRGLHFQFGKHAETKMIRAVKGGIVDFFVDLRLGSETFGQWDCIELTEENKKMVIIPKGFAHGFMSIEDGTEIIYKVDNFYSPENEGGILWNDKDLAIPWGIENPIISEKDANQMTFETFKKKYNGIKL